MQVWTAISFASWHYLVMRTLVQPGYAEIVVVGVLLLGALCARLYGTTRSITIPVLVHMAADLAIIIVFITLLHKTGQI